MCTTAIKTCSCVKNRFFRFKRHYNNECSDGSGSSSDESQSVTSLYDARKFSHPLPENTVNPPFEPLPSMPTGIFRCTHGEVIGPLAGKCAYYRNPEYYSFHHMSFFDLHMLLLPSRKPQIKTGRKP